ncbi:hypothetical protein GCM10029964_010630 [Kibdelosporangium lantanae]
MYESRVRTSGPCRPWGRRSTSTSSGGSWLGAPNLRRIDSATADANFTASSSLTPSTGWHTNITSASEP